VSRSWLMVSFAASVCACSDDTNIYILNAAGMGGDGGGSGIGGSSGSSATGGASSGGAQTGGASVGGAEGGAPSGGSGSDAGSTGTAGNGGGSSGTSGASGSSGTSGSGGASGGAGSGGSSGSAGTSTGGGDSGGTAGSAGACNVGGVDGGSACATQGYAFCDTFEDQNANGWTESGDPWSFAMDGSWVYQGSGASRSVAGDACWGDQSFEARVKATFTGTSSAYRAGLAVRYNTPTTFYMVALDGTGSMRLWRGNSSVGGSGECGAVDATVSADEWFDLRIVVSGTTSVRIQTFVNGGAVHDCTTITNPFTVGRVGVVSVGGGTEVQVDDVLVSLP
jgi:3-keto-disaccharide hydrolase